MMLPNSDILSSWPSIGEIDGSTTRGEAVGTREGRQFTEVSEHYWWQFGIRLSSARPTRECARRGELRAALSSLVSIAIPCPCDVP